VREVDEVHDAEDKSKPGGDQEQEDAELRAVQELDQQEVEGHGRPFVTALQCDRHGRAPASGVPAIRASSAGARAAGTRIARARP
jgi:hypothetical protein